MIEERSRFEKWTAKQIKAISPLWELERDGSYVGYVVRDPTEMVAILNRAALEDRQEAAPIKEGLKDLSVHLLRRFAEFPPPYDGNNECSFCGVKEGNQHWHTCSWLTTRTIFGVGPGVPSEATKENL